MSRKPGTHGYIDPEDWRHASADTRRGGWRLAVVIIVVVLFCAGLSIAHWGFGVFTSDLKGRGDAERKINSAENRILAQEDFEKRFEDILASDRNIDVLAAEVAASPTNADAKVRLTGAKLYCNQVVGEYNAKARSVSAARFQSLDLPHQIDNNDPTTDCKEGAK